MKNSKKKFIIALVVVLLLGLAIGYASFTDSLTITASATTADTSWDVHFSNARVVDKKGCAASAKVNGEDPDKVTVSVTDLAYPGAGANIQATIKNDGQVSAKLENLVVGNVQNDDIKFKFPSDLENQVLKPGDFIDVNFSIEWDSASTNETPTNLDEFEVSIQANQVIEEPAFVSVNSIEKHSTSY